MARLIPRNPLQFSDQEWNTLVNAWATHDFQTIMMVVQSREDGYRLVCTALEEDADMVKALPPRAQKPAKKQKPAPKKKPAKKKGR